MTQIKHNLSKRHSFPLSSNTNLIVYGEDASGFAAMRLVDRDGDFLHITMAELLNAVSAAYYCQKGRKKT